MTFSIRDLALVTFIVALVLGWWVREVQLQSELARANRWRNAAGTLEEVVEAEGFDVRWQFDSLEPGVEVSQPGGARWHAITSSREPSPDQVPKSSGQMPGMPASQSPATNPPNVHP